MHNGSLPIQLDDKGLLATASWVNGSVATVGAEGSG